MIAPYRFLCRSLFDNVNLSNLYPGFHNAKYTTLKIMALNTTSIDTLETALQPIFDEAIALAGGKVSIKGYYTHYKTYGDYLFPPCKAETKSNATTKKLDDSIWFPGQRPSKIITSWLSDKKALENPGVRTALRDCVDNGTLMWSDFTAPGPLNPPLICGGGNAVNPA
jgi:hypothetical protein